MKHNITPELSRAFIRRAVELGYEVKQVQDVNDKNVCLVAYREDKEVCIFDKSGGMQYYQTNPLIMERDELHNLLLSLKEAHDLYAEAKPLKGVEVKDYRLISEYGEAVLAAKKDSLGDIRFTTWNYTYDHTGVTMGHYYECNYEEAKKDFIIRSGLLPENQVFTKEELLILYTACVFQGKIDNSLLYEEEHKLWDLTEKLFSNLPEKIKNYQINRSEEQEDSRGIQPD